MIEPAQPLLAQATAALAGDYGVERHQPERMVLDRIVEKPARRQIPIAGKGAAHCFALVVIAGDEVDRTGQRRQQLAQQLVFLRSAEIGEVAGGDHDIGRGIERGHGGDGLRQAGRRIDDAVGDLAARLDVEVADLGDEHHCLM